MNKSKFDLNGDHNYPYLQFFISLTLRTRRIHYSDPQSELAHHNDTINILLYILLRT